MGVSRVSTLKIHGHWARRRRWKATIREQLEEYFTEREISSVLRDLISEGILRRRVIRIRGRRRVGLYPYHPIEDRGLRICETLEIPFKRCLASYMYYTAEIKKYTPDPFAFIVVFGYSFFPCKYFLNCEEPFGTVERFAKLVEYLEKIEEYLKTRGFGAGFRTALEGGAIYRRDLPEIEEKEVDFDEFIVPWGEGGAYKEHPSLEDILTPGWRRIIELNKLYGYVLFYHHRTRRVRAEYLIYLPEFKWRRLK